MSCQLYVKNKYNQKIYFLVNDFKKLFVDNADNVIKKKITLNHKFIVERFYIRDVQLQSNFYRGSLHTWVQQDWIPHHIISCRAVFLGVRVDSLELNVFLFKNDFKSFLPYFLV